MPRSSLRRALIPTFPFAAFAYYNCDRDHLSEITYVSPNCLFPCTPPPPRPISSLDREWARRSLEPVITRLDGRFDRRLTFVIIKRRPRLRAGQADWWTCVTVHTVPINAFLPLCTRALLLALSASNDRELRGSMISSCCESEESERDIACLGDGGFAGNPFLTLQRDTLETHIVILVIRYNLRLTKHNVNTSWK